eukprot:Ihof_evm2s48 gene=Ihof_evmTU2s48
MVTEGEEEQTGDGMINAVNMMHSLLGYKPQRLEKDYKESHSKLKKNCNVTENELMIQLARLDITINQLLVERTNLSNRLVCLTGRVGWPWLSTPTW